MRIYELAKELGITNKELLAELHEAGISAKSHMNRVEEDVAERIRSKRSKPVKAQQVEPGKMPTDKGGHTPQTPVETPSRPVDTLTETTKKTAGPVSGKKVITLRGTIIVRELADHLNMKPNQLIAELMTMNVFASINERLDIKLARQVAEKHGFILEHEKRAVDQKPRPKQLQEDETEEDRPEDMEPRHPVVTFLGHIDHGKTSLLDRIRNSAIAKSEAGGITQHIGAYVVEQNGHCITFLDTPGHAAFTAMRARGANLTDIAVIMIAADDGIMPQTEEAIKHAQAANTTIFVAINKMDLPNANQEHVMQQLQAIGLVPEEWGGTVICCPVSAQTGQGVDHLLEMILLQADVLELKANPKARAQGYVIEAQMEQGMGPTVNFLVTRGTLHVGDIIVCGPYWGRVKALLNDHGVKVRTAGPSMPVKCLGLSGVPQAGEQFKVYSNDKVARSVAEARSVELRTHQLTTPKKVSLDDLFDQMNKNDRLDLHLILKCDTQGSLEAIQQSLDQIKSDKVTITIILAGVGNINVNDVLLASASDAVIIGFHVSKEEGVTQAEKQEGVEIRFYSIIYQIIDHIKEAMTGMLAPEIREKHMGNAEVRQIFPFAKKEKVAGCLVINGRISSRCKARVKRGEDIIYEGSIISLKRFQDDASEVRETQECGVRLDNFSDFEAGDIIEFFDLESIPQEL